MTNSESTPTSTDWEQDDKFDYTDALTLPEWGWEFLRRNPDYRKIWETAGDEGQIAQHEAHTIVEKQGTSRFSEWGLLFGSDPQWDSRSSVVIWQPELCGRVLRLNAFSMESGQGCDLHLPDIACKWFLLCTANGQQHVLFRDGLYALQLIVEGTSLLKPVQLMPAEPLNRESEQFRVYQCFGDLLVSSRLLPSHFPPTYLGGRLKNVLRALDGDLAGASQRQIATMLFGQECVENEWCAAGRPLRDKVRRAIHRGHDLMQSGYRSLIR